MCGDTSLWTQLRKAGREPGDWLENRWGALKPLFHQGKRTICFDFTPTYYWAVAGFSKLCICSDNVVLFLLGYTKCTPKDRTHLWFCGLFSWHSSGPLASYSNMKLPLKCQEAAHLLFENDSCSAAVTWCPVRWKVSPQAGSEPRNSTLTNARTPFALWYVT